MQAVAKPAEVEPAGDGEVAEGVEDGAAASGKPDKKAAPTSLSRKVRRSDGMIQSLFVFARDSFIFISFVFFVFALFFRLVFFFLFFLFIC